MTDATIILAGGVGTRLWPASLRHHPKQLLRIGGGDSLLQRAVIRARAAAPDGPTVIVTGRDQVDGIIAHVKELSSRYPSLARQVVVLPEPAGKNTAPAITLAVHFLAGELDAKATVLVLTADHMIEPLERFAADAARAARLAAAGHLVCFGIEPDRPETGYGYVRAGGDLDGGFAVQGFTEKPDSQTAARYLADGGYFWNAGMFCFTLGLFRDELAAHAPGIAEPFAVSADVAASPGPHGVRVADPDLLIRLYEQLPKISIDYALMERSERVAMVPASFSWNDVGSWDQVAAAVHEEAGGPPVIQVEAGNNYVDGDLPVAICGVSDVHVIVRNGMVLVCRRDRGQLVKQVVEQAESAGLDNLL